MPTDEYQRNNYYQLVLKVAQIKIADVFDALMLA